MKSQKRYLTEEIRHALVKKIVLLGGPRQVGKTTVALSFLSPVSAKNPSYLNWDRNSDKEMILKDQIPLASTLIVLDEIHKYRLWRNLIKGLYDKYHEEHQFLVTGSARLDYFRKGGDSLLGRFRHFRLHPFSLLEMTSKPNQSDVETLLAKGGFPEPLFSMTEKESRIWRRDRTQTVISQDLRDLETVKDSSLLLLLAELLPEKVGSPLSLRSLMEDLHVSQPTIQRWIELLELVYFCYSVSPYGSSKVRAVKKLQKIYLWDWAQVEALGPRLENMVASQLLKYCHWIEDTEGHKMELRYLRDTDGREVDFVVLKNKKPIFAVECKSGDSQLSSSISYFQQRTPIPAFYQVHLKERDYGHAKTGRVLPWIRFCQELGMP